MTRVWTALLLVPTVLAAVVWAPAWLFAALLAVVAWLGVGEFYGLAAASGLRPYRWVGGVASVGLVVLLSVPVPHPARALLAAVLAVLLAVLLAALAQPERMAEALGNAGATLLGVFYPGLLLGLLGAIRQQALGEVWLVYMLLVVWLGDTAALYLGRWRGRRPLAPRVSPKKSREGAAASLAAAILVGAGFGWWLGDSRLVGLAVGLNVAAQAGDLVESLLKRGAQVKDSGSLLPGHGGVLDRVDAMLFAAAVLWYYLVLLP